jgi:hypothetical protein
MSEKEVYKRAALVSIYNSASLSILHADLARKYRNDLPSWVPDWEAPGNFGDSVLLDPIDLYDTCSSYPINKGTVRSSENALQIDTKVIDVVNEVSSVMLSVEPNSVSSTLFEWLGSEKIDEIPRILGHKMDMDSNKENDWVSGLCKVLCAEIINYPGYSAQRVQPGDQSKLRAWFRHSHLSPVKHSIESSAGGNPWINIRHLELSIRNKDPNSSARAFRMLIPMARDQVEIIQNVLSEQEFDESFPFQSVKSLLSDCYDIDSTAYSYRDFTTSATGSVQEICTTIWSKIPWNAKRPPIDAVTMAAARLQNIAWSYVPWTRVYERYKIHERLRFCAWESLDKRAEAERVSIGKEVAVIDHSVTSAVKSRRLFFTQGDCIGLGPASMKPGDNLCLLKGGRTPFILRQKNLFLSGCDVFEYQEWLARNRNHSPGSSETTPIRKFELIGDCYANGLMDAKTLDKETANIWQTLYTASYRDQGLDIQPPDWETGWLE